MVTRRVIEANPEKVQAIISMSSPKNIQEVKRLIGRITALARFISRSAEKSLPFFKALRKTKDFEWSDETYSRGRVVPLSGCYSSSNQFGPCQKRRNESSTRIFVSHALKGPELNYLTQEKLALALVITARKLRPYFLSHPITVLTNSVLGKIATNLDASGRLIRWIIELSEYDIKFEPRTAIKAQALAYFLAETVQLDFRASNNEAEYEALLLGLKAARNLGISRATLYSDSQLAIQQSNGNFEIKDDKMRKYAKALDKAKEGFTELNLELIPRAENIKADHLARLASALSDRPDPSVAGRSLVSQLETLDDMLTQVPKGDWRYDLHRYLTAKELPIDNKKAKEIKRRALCFDMIDQILFKRSYSQPLLKCLGPDEENYVLRDIHEGSCESQLGSLALARKSLLAGFFWPTMRKDSSDLWGMDIVGSFPVSMGQRKFLLVAVDYFSKWVEGEPLSKITENEVLNFLWKNIVCLFGIPRRLASDNGRQLCGSKVRAWCQEMKIEQVFTSVAYPQGNAQVEVTNRTIVQALKTRLDVAKGETPFSMVYGTEVVLPAEIGQESARIMAYGTNNQELRAMDLNLLVELRSRASIRLAAYRKRMTQAYNKIVYPKLFQEGDLVM
ncbi:uncharacterized protein [Henckelia pumila]|uniref:uncharacterized protein n=1 Tax=Henckelia pumila TaxID=405737 RepID=UPI003C6E5C4F